MIIELYLYSKLEDNINLDVNIEISGFKNLFSMLTANLQWQYSLQRIAKPLLISDLGCLDKICFIFSFWFKISVVKVQILKD